MLKSKLQTLCIATALIMGATAIPSVIFEPTVTAYAAESSVATASIEEILENQQSDGGWRKNYNTTSGEWSKSTIDNDATYTEIRKLAAEYSKTKDSKYSDAVIKGINFLINMQYSNGGWPQVYKSSGYHAAITYNDNAMINVMTLLDEVSNKSGDFSFVDSALASKSKKAVDKGVECILNTQVVVNGKLTIWGQQHDKDTLKPTTARAFEPASLCTSESAKIVKFLMTRDSNSKIQKSINAAKEWFKTNQIKGIKVVKKNGDVVVEKNSSASPIWARFYEIGTNKPIFVGRDSVVKYNLSEIEKERRTGYSWYGTWPASLIK